MKTDPTIGEPDGEPLIHSHNTDVLPESHLLAYETVSCEVCGVMLHCYNNECMQTWLEWGPHRLCMKCALPLLADGVLDYSDFETELKSRRPAPTGS